jgi:hypothetical protein
MGHSDASPSNGAHTTPCLTTRASRAALRRSVPRPNQPVPRHRAALRSRAGESRDTSNPADTLARVPADECPRYKTPSTWCAATPAARRAASARLPQPSPKTRSTSLQPSSAGLNAVTDHLAAAPVEPSATLRAAHTPDRWIPHRRPGPRGTTSKSQHTARDEPNSFRRLESLRPIVGEVPPTPVALLQPSSSGSSPLRPRPACRSAKFAAAGVLRSAPTTALRNPNRRPLVPRIGRLASQRRSSDRLAATGRIPARDQFTRRPTPEEIFDTANAAAQPAIAVAAATAATTSLAFAGGQRRSSFRLARSGTRNGSKAGRRPAVVSACWLSDWTLESQVLNLPPRKAHRHWRSEGANGSVASFGCEPVPAGRGSEN